MKKQLEAEKKKVCCRSPNLLSKAEKAALQAEKKAQQEKEKAAKAAEVTTITMDTSLPEANKVCPFITLPIATSTPFPFN